jgi:hypothetical protein
MNRRTFLQTLALPAAALVASGWCQRDAAVNALGESVNPSDPSAAAWCVWGALCRAARDAGATIGAFHQARVALEKAIDPKTDHKDIHYGRWNDARERKQEHVVRTLTKAAEIAREREQRTMGVAA